jgi:cell division protein FtsB
MKAEEAEPLDELEQENGRLEKVVADLSLDVRMLKEIARGNL